jgi:hypothetical protein
MTLTEKYIQKISSDLGIVSSSNSYSFPCPFCSHLPTSSGKIKLKREQQVLYLNKIASMNITSFVIGKGANLVKVKGRKVVWDS